MLNNLQNVVRVRQARILCGECDRLQIKLDEALRENVELKSKIKKLEAHSIPIGAHTPSGQIPSYKKRKKEKTESKEKRMGGAVLGHKGSGRKSFEESEVDREEFVPGQTICPYCEGETVGNGTIFRSVVDIPPVKLEKVLYECERRRCRCCGKTNTGEVGALAKCLYGNRLVSQVAVLHYIQGIPLGRICEIYEGLEYGAIIGALHRVAKIFKCMLPILTEEYRKAYVKYADETSWNIDGTRGWAWLFSTDQVTLLLCEDNRSARVPAKVFGTEPLLGVLVIDRYAGYNAVLCLKQLCYCHLSRDVKKLLAEFPDEPKVAAFVDNLVRVLSQAIKLQKAPISDLEYYESAQFVSSQILAITSKEEEHFGIKSVQSIFQNNTHRLYHWVTNRSIPSHNNSSEQQIRRHVISRKVSFGSQSIKGAKTRSTLYSVLATAKKRNPDVKIEDWLSDFLNQYASDPDFDVIANFPQQINPP